MRTRRGESEFHNLNLLPSPSASDRAFVSLSLPRYYFINTFICAVATFSYFAMLSGQGWTAIAGCRQFFYVRYLDWLVTTPLLILDLGGWRVLLGFLIIGLGLV